MPTNVLIPNVSIDERIGSVFNYLFHIINDSEKSEDETVEWNFKNASFFHPFFLAPLAIYKHRCGKKIHCINNPQNISDYFSTIAFHKPLSIQAESDIKALLEPYKHKTYTPICAFRASEEKVADELQSVLQMLIENQTNYDRSVKTRLSYLLSEIICNVNQHSCSEYGYIFAQYLRKEGCIDICIADDGITVYGSYIKNKKYLEEIGDNEAKALRMANDGFSTKDSPERGYGLNTSRRLLTKGMGGDFFMLSGSAFYRLSKDRDEVVELPKTIRWDGTIVLMRIPVTLPKHFNIYEYI